MPSEVRMAKVKWANQPQESLQLGKQDEYSTVDIYLKD
jgi:hypothetical protein